MEQNKIYILHDIGKTELTPEEAKEHLSDTELPPNMKKIIEGVGKMGRLEEIKNRYDGWEPTLGLNDGDVPWLISRLEIAEKALEKIAKNGKTDVDGEDAENMLIMCGDIADEALKKIRE